MKATKTKRVMRKAATKKRRSNKAPSAKQLAARKKFALAAKARSKAAKNPSHDTYGWATHKTVTGYKWEVTGFTHGQGTEVLKSGVQATREKAAKQAKEWVLYFRRLKRKNPTRKQNKTVIVKPKRVLVVNGKATRRKYRNGYLDLVIRGTAEKTSSGWKVGGKTIPQGKGIAPISSGYYLDKATGMIFAKRARNVAAGFFDGSGAFHPIRSSADYDPSTAGETGGKPKHTRSKKKRAATKKASATARHRAATAARKKTTSRLASRSLFRSTPLKRTRKRNSAGASPATKALRETFVGMPSRKTSTMNVANGTPTNLAKLGKLVLIKAEGGTIKPANGTNWLCADAKGKLHIATTAARIIDGPAQNFGEVSQIEYEARKPHLGYKNQTIFFHKMGEEGGKKPVLIADGKGGLKLRGGSYKIEREGIVN